MRLKYIDRYILFQFLRTYLFVVLVLVLVVSVIDYSEKSDDFLKKNIPFGEILFDYYLNFILYIANLVTPITVFIATVFVTARFASRTEIIAMLSSGMSLLRIFLPFAVGASMIASITFFVNGWVMPKANKTRIQFEIMYTRNPFFYDERNIHIKMKDDVYAYMLNYNNNTRNGYRFTMEKIVDRQLLEKLSADIITYDTVNKMWNLPSYQRHIFNNERETIIKGRDMDTILSIHPSDFESKHMLQETLNLQELDTYVKKQKDKGNSDVGVFLVEKFQRYSSPFAIIILTFMGVTLSSRKSRQGTSTQIAMGFILAFAFLILVILTRSLGQAGTILPQVAAWLPVVLFGVLSMFLYRAVPK